MRYNYCPICGRKLTLMESWDEGKVPFCEHDQKMYFDTPIPCVIVAVVKQDQILLLKQSYIFKDSKVLVSGYVTTGETVEQTVRREVKEETGIEVDEIKYLGSEYLESKEILMLTYMAKYVSGEICKSPEVEWVEWGNLNNALSEMKEDEIGKRVVRKVLKEIAHKDPKVFRVDI